jgi:hypothetical protein
MGRSPRSQGDTNKRGLILDERLARLGRDELKQAEQPDARELSSDDRGALVSIKSVRIDCRTRPSTGLPNTTSPGPTGKRVRIKLPTTMPRMGSQALSLRENSSTWQTRPNTGLRPLRRGARIRIPVAKGWPCGPRGWRPQTLSQLGSYAQHRTGNLRPRGRPRRPMAFHRLAGSFRAAPSHQRAPRSAAGR